MSTICDAHAGLRLNPLVPVSDYVVVEPSEYPRFVFQAEVPPDLLERVERVDVPCLETGRVAVCVAADDHRSSFPRFFDCGLFSVSFIGFSWIDGMGPGAYRRREISNEHHGPADGVRSVGWESVEIIFGCL